MAIVVALVFLVQKTTGAGTPDPAQAHTTLFLGLTGLQSAIDVNVGGTAILEKKFVI